MRRALLLALLATALASLTGCDDGPILFPADVGCTFVLQDGTVLRSSPEVCGAPECTCAGACSDVVRLGGDVVAEACYGTDFDDRERVAPETGNVIIDAPEEQVLISFDDSPDADIDGDLNIDAAGSVDVIGRGREESDIFGNVNIHSGEVRIRGVTVHGDVSVNDGAGDSSIAHCRILGNLNVHAEGFIVLNCEVFGTVNLDRDGAVLIGLGVGGDFNVHGEGHRCEDVYDFVDTDADQRVAIDERTGALSCAPAP